MPYSVDRVIVARDRNDQQMRAAIITSLASHLAVAAALVVVPLVWTPAPIMPSLVPVQFVMPPAAAPPPAPEASTPAPIVEEEPEPLPPEPEPEPAAVEEEVVPESLENIRREAEAAAEREREAEAERARLAAEAQRRKDAEEAAAREREREAAAERERQAEEARRQQPQKAARRGAAPPAETQSAQRTGIDLTGAEDDTRGFTVEDFPFAHYLGRIRDLIATRWSPPPRGPYAPQRRAEVFFRIGRDGRLVVQPRISTASGETLFDRAALQAIAQAAPFPPLPREYQGQSLGVGLAFVQE
jgi:colicin import membrane protein